MGLEVVGVAVIVLGALITFGVFLQRLIKEGGLKELVHQFRRDLGMAILLGLEFLIASDIVGTLAEPELSGLGIIGTFDSDPDISELYPAIGNHRTLALARTDLTKGNYMQSL